MAKNPTENCNLCQWAEGGSCAYWLNKEGRMRSLTEVSNALKSPKGPYAFTCPNPKRRFKNSNK